MKKAVALKYPEGAPSPFVTASARGEAAERLAAIAKEQGIAVVEKYGRGKAHTFFDIVLRKLQKTCHTIPSYSFNNFTHL